MGIAFGGHLGFQRWAKSSGAKGGNAGFTFIELLLYIMVSSILLAATMLAFKAQSTTYNAQYEISKVQQNIRAAISYMTKELRYAGFDPSGEKNAGFDTAATDKVTFSYLVDNQTPVGIGSDDDLRFITYWLSDGELKRKIKETAATTAVLAKNIEQLRFEYLLNDRETWVGAPTNLNNIIAVKIIMLGVTEHMMKSAELDNFVPALEENGASADWTQGSEDSLGRRMLSVTVQCRNLGM